MADDKKFYWLKLKRDFFKRHDVRIIEAMPNGKDYLLFYLKLLVESVDHNGNLRFSDEIPYNEDMLSIITNTNVDIVRSAIKMFTQLNMMELLDDGTYFMSEVDRMIGSAVDNDNANRQRRFRERQKELKKELELQECYDSVTKNNESIEYRDKSIDTKENNTNNTISVKEKSPRSRFSKPSVEDIKEYITKYCKEKYDVKPVINEQEFYDYYESKGWVVGSRSPMKDWEAAVRNWINKRVNDNPSIIKTLKCEEEGNEVNGGFRWL